MTTYNDRADLLGDECEFSGTLILDAVAPARNG